MKKIIIATLTTAVLVNLFGAEKPKMPAPKVDVYEVGKPSDIKIDLTYPATITPLAQINVVSRVSGVLTKKHFNEGDFVKKGTLLYTIEDTIYKARYDAAHANLSMAEAEYNNASKNWERNQKLYQSKSISDEKRDSSLFGYESAKAKVALAKANLAQAKIDLDYASVKAPIDGYTSLQKVDVGDYVNITQQLLTMTQNKKLYVEFSIPSSDYEKIKKNIWTTTNNKEIELSIIKNENDTKVVGVVDFIDINVDRSTSTVKMRALVDNKNGVLSAGDFVRIKLNNLIQKNVMMIPQKALLQSAQGTIVFIAKDGKAQVRPVAISDEVGDKYTLTWSMLQPGDNVIVNNFFRAKPMQAVMVDKVINKIEQKEK